MIKPIKFLSNWVIVITMMMGLSAFEAKSQTKRALLIGISDYGNEREDPNKWSNISGANDVALLLPLFKQQEYKIVSLVDSMATYINIIDALKKIAKDAEKGDIIYLHFSMHGQPFEDLNGDEEDGWDEALIPVDAQLRYKEDVYEGEKHLLDDELEKYINIIRSQIGASGKLYVVLDACHSGTASRGGEGHVRGVRDGFTRSGKYYTPDRTQETNDYFKVPTKEGQSSVTFIEACRSYQQNREVRDRSTNIWYGSLSYYIAQSMQDYQIGKTEEWIETVKSSMANDRRLRRQNIVIEKSE